MIKAGIVGGTGYTGVELLRILAGHPQVEVCLITSRAESGRPVADLFPSLRGHYDLEFSMPDLDALKECDVVFFATPHGVAQSMMSDFVGGKTRIIDLSADFRIKDIQTWESWYGQEHGCPDLVDLAVYGLPETNRSSIKNAQLIACPGCYPTSVQLGFKPLLENNLVDPTALIANSASGTSGAGRQANIGALQSEVGESFMAYKAGGHRHLPEIEQGLRALQPEGSEAAQVTFVPHLIPMVRGIHSTLFAKLTGKVEDLQSLYEAHYKNEPFVDVLPAGKFPETRTVRTTNTCRLSIIEPQERGTVVIMSVIDNLTKGASGQAVQCLNIMFGFDEREGLRAPALLP